MMPVNVPIYGVVPLEYRSAYMFMVYRSMLLSCNCLVIDVTTEREKQLNVHRANLL